MLRKLFMLSLLILIPTHLFAYTKIVANKDTAICASVPDISYSKSQYFYVSFQKSGVSEGRCYILVGFDTSNISWDRVESVILSMYGYGVYEGSDVKFSDVRIYKMSHSWKETSTYNDLHKYLGLTSNAIIGRFNKSGKFVTCPIPVSVAKDLKNGVILALDKQTTTNPYFNSRECFDVTLRPYLIIEYKDPK